MWSFEDTLETVVLPSMSVGFNLGGLIVTGIKTDKAWDHASTKLRACGVATGVLEFGCLPSHVYGLIPAMKLAFPDNQFLDRVHNPKWHTGLDVVAFALQASVVGILSWIKAKHHSSSRSVEDMGWSVLVLGFANLVVTLVAVFVANGAGWYGWIKESWEKFKRACVEWMGQGRTLEVQEDEEHNLENTQSPAPAIPQQPSIFPFDNN